MSPQIDRTWKNRKTACEKGECAHLDVDADAGNNCVFNCTHPACYELVYAADPLEPGEVDEKRYNSFVACIRKDLRSSNSKVCSCMYSIYRERSMYLCRLKMVFTFSLESISLLIAYGSRVVAL